MPSSKLTLVLLVALRLSHSTRALDGLGGTGGSKSSSKSRRLDQKAYRKRRGLESADKLLDVDQLLSTCGDTDYSGFLFVDEHIYAVALPEEEAMAAGCPMFAVHAVFESERGGGNKELLQWKDLSVGKPLFPQDDALAIGTFKLTELWRAYQEADANASGHAVYDIVTNNCGTFAVNLASKLGVPIDTRTTSFVARRLLQHSGKELLRRVHLSVSYQSLLDDRQLRAETVSDEDLVNLLVDYQTLESH